MSSIHSHGANMETFIAVFSRENGSTIRRRRPPGDDQGPHKVAVVGHHFSGCDQISASDSGTEHADEFRLTGLAPGCHSTVVAHTSGLSACTDPVGQFPLYSAQSGGRVLVGPSAAVLAAEIGDSIDPVQLATRIACPDMPDLFATRTMYRNVDRIPEGTVLRIDACGTRQSEHHRIRADPSISLAEVAEQLRDRLLASVQARTEAASRLTADFSGGFDSTSLAFLAATSGAPVATLTSYHEDLSTDTDDIERARRFAGLNKRLAHHMVPGSAEHLPFQDLVAASEEPHGAPIFLGPMRERLAAASNLGADLHVVGEGGDVVLGAPPAYLADLARRGDLTTLWRHCVSWARLRTRSPLKLFRQAVTVGTTSRSQALRNLARAIQNGRSGEFPTWEDDWICYGRRPWSDWLTARARRQLAANVFELADHDASNDNIGDLVTRSWLRSQTLTQQAIREAGNQVGISVHAPFLDSDVVRTCLSLPAHLRVNPNVAKPLLRAALTDLIPKAVLSHPAKGDYTKESHHGVRRAAPTLRRLFAESATADHGLLEPGPVRLVLDRAIQGFPTPWGALSQVIAVELWLRENQGR